MPRITDDTQPPLRSRFSILLTLSSSMPITEARLATLARGILAVILSRRRCSPFRGCRGAIAIPHASIPLPWCRYWSVHLSPASIPLHVPYGFSGESRRRRWRCCEGVIGASL